MKSSQDDSLSRQVYTLAEIQSESIRDIPLSDISVIPDHNGRKKFPEEKIRKLGKSIRTNGLFEPIILIRPPKDAGISTPYALIAGECRYRGIKMEGLPSVAKSEVYPEAAWKFKKRIAHIENAQRSDLTLWEEAVDILATILAEYSHLNTDRDRFQAYANDLSEPYTKIEYSCAVARRATAFPRLVALLENETVTDLTAAMELIKGLEAEVKQASSRKRIMDNVLDALEKDVLNGPIRKIMTQVKGYLKSDKKRPVVAKPEKPKDGTKATDKPKKAPAPKKAPLVSLTQKFNKTFQSDFDSFDTQELDDKAIEELKALRSNIDALLNKVSQ